MKATQSSVGRELEQFQLWIIPMCDRLPKNSRSLDELGRKLVRDINEAQCYTRLALKTSDVKARLDIIESVILLMEDVKSIMDAFVEYSSTGNIRILSLKQKSAYLTQIESISRQLGGWARKTKHLVDEDRGEIARQECD